MPLEIEKDGFPLPFCIGSFFVKGGHLFSGSEVPFDDMTFLSSGEEPIEVFGCGCGRDRETVALASQG